MEEFVSTLSPTRASPMKKLIAKLPPEEET